MFLNVYFLVVEGIVKLYFCFVMYIQYTGV